jgi:ribosome modulation factor
MDYPIKSIEDLMVEGATAKVAGAEEEACPYEEGRSTVTSGNSAGWRRLPC